MTLDELALLRHSQAGQQELVDHSKHGWRHEIWAVGQDPESSLAHVPEHQVRERPSLATAKTVELIDDKAVRPAPASAQAPERLQRILDVGTPLLERVGGEIQDQADIAVFEERGDVDHRGQPEVRTAEQRT